MARIAAVFQVWLVAYRDTDGDFYDGGVSGYFWSASATTSGLFASYRKLSSSNSLVGSSQCQRESVFQFVAFGIKNAGLWGACPLIPFDSLKNDNRPLPLRGRPIWLSFKIPQTLRIRRNVTLMRGSSTRKRLGNACS